ncbi:MAG TPA: tetratricopeptide repeat protein [Stellaceae bacterium]|nr:tetratricopeptide repeat protein [Stellaceae bacterium]
MQTGAGAGSKFGGAHGYIGRAEETEGHVQEALRLSPRDIEAYVWILFAGIAKLALRADEEAVARLRRAVEINRNLPVQHFMLAAALAHLGRLDDARSATQAGLALDPAFTVSRLRAGVASDNPTYPAHR